MSAMACLHQPADSSRPFLRCSTVSLRFASFRRNGFFLAHACFKGCEGSLPLGVSFLIAPRNAEALMLDHGETDESPRPVPKDRRISEREAATKAPPMTAGQDTPEEWSALPPTLLLLNEHERPRGGFISRCGPVPRTAHYKRPITRSWHSAPTPAVSAIASAPQNVTRIAPTVTPAPPARAANPPRSARNNSEVPETNPRLWNVRRLLGQLRWLLRRFLFLG
jgi:hypothetical protein